MIVAIKVAAVVVAPCVCAASPLLASSMTNEPDRVAGDITEDKAGTAMAGDEMMKEEGVISDKDYTTLQKGGSMMTGKELTGMFEGSHNGTNNSEGGAKAVRIEEGDVLEVEHQRVTNCPDLYICLVTDKQASDFVDLRKRKTNYSNQNYDLPQGADLSKYDTLLVSCKQFSVLFASAEQESIMST